MPSNSISSRYYPRLSSIVTLDELPGILDFLKEPGNAVFEKMYFKDLQFSKSQNGDKVFYSLSLISRDRLDVEIPGTGIYLILNPDIDNSEISSLPITLDFNWPILSYVRQFSDTSSPLDLQEIFLLGLDMLGLSPMTIASNFINVFVDRNNATNGLLEQCVLDLNTQFTSNPITTPLPLEYKLTDLLVDIESQFQLDPVIALMLTYLGDFNNPTEFKSKLNQFFKNVLPFDDFEEYILGLLIPKFSTSLELSAAIEFPRNMLLPLEDDGNGNFNPIPEENDLVGNPTGAPRVSFLVDGATFNASTQKGIYVDQDLSGSMSNRARIGNTGFTIDIQKVKIDINDDRNIPEADIDGRPVSFKGVYVQEAIIGLPPFVNPESGNVEIFTTDLLIGNEGGISGVIGVQGMQVGIKEELLEIVITDTSPTNDTPHPVGIVVNHTTKKVSVFGTVFKEDGTPVKVRNYDFEYDAEDLYLRDAINRQFKIEAATGLVTPATYSPGPLHFNIGQNTTLELNEFTLVFHQDELISGSITGTLSNPSFKDSNNVPVPITVTIDIKNGFLITLTVPQGSDGLTVINTDAVELFISELHLGEQSDIWNFGIQCVIVNKSNLPVISKVLPTKVNINHFNFVQGEPADFDIYLEWANGIEVGGTDDGGFAGAIPFNFGSNSPVQLEQIKFNVASVPDGLDIRVDLQGAAIKIGPFQARADGMGFLAYVREDANGEGNFGRTNVDLEFVKPSGLGISFVTEAVTVSGYLFLDHVNHRYFGYIQVDIADKFELMAIGLLQKGMPDHPETVSFIALITMELPTPIAVGFGFELTHVGGIIGVNRTMDSDAIREGVYTGGLDHILFPDDPINNIMTIIANLEAVFPPKKGQISLGVMGKFRNSEALTVELGFMIALPNPVVIAVIGVIKLVVGEEDDEVVKIYCVFAIVLDFGQKLFSLDASLVKSEIAGIVIEGDIAARFSWGNEKFFLVSVGGFHPSYVVSDAFKLGNMKRVALIITNTDNTKIMAQFYTAITSNTFQAGGRVDVDIVLGPVGVIAYFGMDILFKFNPFYLDVMVALGAAIQYNGKDIMSLYLDLRVRGPKPWYITGRGEFKVLMIKVGFNIDVEIGDAADTALDTVDVLPLLLEDLEADRSYTTTPQGRSGTDVVFLDTEGSEAVILDPYGRLEIDQQIAPLDLAINKYGESPTPATDRFLMTDIRLGGQSANIEEKVTEYFAPNQYVKISDAEKLTSNSFEPFENGRVIGGDSMGIKISEFNRGRDLDYELKYREREVSDIESSYNLADDMVEKFSRGGAFGKSAGFKKARRAGRAKGKMVRIKEVDYGIVIDRNIRLKDNSSSGMSRAKANDILKELDRIDPGSAKHYGVKPSYEYRAAATAEEEEDLSEV